MPGSVSPASGVGRSRFAPVIAGVLILSAGMLLRAGDAPAPPTFEEIKGDLKAIRRDSNAPVGQGTSRSKVALPGLRASPDSPAAAPARPPPAADVAPDGRRPADSNWLLDGLELQTKPGPAARPRAAGTSRDETPLIDVSDPAFMLRLYLAQPAARSVPEETRTRDGASGLAAQPGVGSFDMFLSQWVSKRDPALRGLIDAASPTPAGAVSAGPRAEPSPAVPEPASATANPFLAAFKLDWPGTASGGIVSTASSLPAPPPAVAPPPPAPEANATTPAARPPNPANEKKYFPQLNRF